MGKHRKNCGFHAFGSFLCLSSVRARKNFRKCCPGTSKALPGASQTPPKSSPELPKTHKNGPRATTSTARRAKSVLGAPKSKKKCQHGPQAGKRTLGRWPGWVPPKVDTTGIFCLYFQHIDSTRLGTDDGAADLASIMDLRS